MIFDTKTAETILGLIRQYDKIVISRHIRPDGDAVGSSHGLAGLIRLNFPEKQVRVVGDDHSEYVAFLGPDDEQPEDDFYRGALLIVLDTGSYDRISNEKKELAALTVKIDHHIVDVPYGDVALVDDTRSSTCELITAFWYHFRSELSIDSHTALCLYTGMVTDSGRFRFRDVSGETLRCAASLLDVGFDTEMLYSNLYIDDFSVMKFSSDMVRKVRFTPNGVAYIHVTRAMQEKYGLNNEEASNVISIMDSIRGSIIWLAFIDNMTPDKDGKMTTRVRLRSRFVTIKELASRYHGGGHAMASGATVYSARELRALLGDADALIKDYKETHDNWI